MTSPNVVSQLASAAVAPSAPEAVQAATEAPEVGRLAEFLVNFVVEQTGYPAEIVELDADLEADLGIDSIKKAQLFGELGEYFDVQPVEDLTLDDFPTLRHVLDYLTKNISGHTESVTVTTAPLAGPTESVSVPATRPAVQPVAAPVAPVATATQQPATETPDAGQLAEFLVNFVVEQTGYPPEIVELDADLEADLGIDSIKKAQLFGELGEYFDVQPAEDLTLDDFPTLQHVLDYLSENIGAHRTRSAAPGIPRRTDFEARSWNCRLSFWRRSHKANCGMNASNIQSVIIVGAGASGQQIAAQFVLRLPRGDLRRGRGPACRLPAAAADDVG